MQLNVAATILSFRREDLSVNYFLGSQGPRKCIELHLSIFMWFKAKKEQFHQLKERKLQPSRYGYTNTLHQPFSMV